VSAASGRGGPVDRLLSVEEARAQVLSAIPGPLPAEIVGVADALGRILAAAVSSFTDLPPWDNSAMDGYAIRSADVALAASDAPVRLAVTGEVAAGSAPTVHVDAGSAVRIATGAPLPPGADAVVPVEDTTPLDAAGAASGRRGRDAAGPAPAAVLVHVVVRPGDAVRRRGSDLAAHAPILAPGTELTPAAIALAAGAGLSSLTAHRRPRVAVLATGNEVRGTGEALGPAGIPDANGPGLRALVRDSGADAIDLGIAADRLEDVVARLERGIREADAIIVSGGVSVGPYDVVKTAFDRVGTVGLWRVAVQPGKPFAFGLARRPGAAADLPPVLLFGLPGNPVSTFVTFELFVRPALRRLQGRSWLFRPVDRARLLEPVTKSAGRRAFLRVRAERAGDGAPVRDDTGRVLVRLAGGQGSHVLSALAAADALAVVPEETDSLAAGAPVDLWWLDHG
jgi:molybdopterin molybdotransferase